MKKSKTISDIMLKDHKKIEELLKNVKEDIDNGVSIKESFKKFKWELKRHLIIEERAIFLFYNPHNEEDFVRILDVIKEHDVILKILKEIMDDFKSDKKIKIAEIEKLLIKHTKFEDEILYPKLDKELSDFQKEVIIKRMNSLI